MSVIRTCVDCPEHRLPAHFQDFVDAGYSISGLRDLHTLIQQQARDLHAVVVRVAPTGSPNELSLFAADMIAFYVAKLTNQRSMFTLCHYCHDSDPEPEEDSGVDTQEVEH